jgi:hypothetical protein
MEVLKLHRTVILLAVPVLLRPVVAERVQMVQPPARRALAPQTARLQEAAAAAAVLVRLSGNLGLEAEQVVRLDLRQVVLQVAPAAVAAALQAELAECKLLTRA